MHFPLFSLLLILPLTHASPLNRRCGGPLVAAPLATSSLQLNADDQDCFATCMSTTFCLQEEPEVCYCTNDARVQCAIGCSLEQIDLNDCDTGEKGRMLTLSEYGQGTSWAEESHRKHYGFRETRQDPDTGGVIVGGLSDVPKEETTSMAPTGTATGTRRPEETKGTMTKGPTMVETMSLAETSATPMWTPAIEPEEIEMEPTKTTIVKSAEATATKVVTVIANTLGCPSLLDYGYSARSHPLAPEEWFAKNLYLPGCPDPVLRTFEHYLGLDNEQPLQLKPATSFEVHTDEHISTSESINISPPSSKNHDPKNADTVDTITPITPIIPVQPIYSSEPTSLAKRDDTIIPITPIVPVAPVEPINVISKRTTPANPITPVVPLAPISPLQKRRVAKDSDILSSERYTRTRKGAFDVLRGKGKGVESKRKGKGKKEDEDVLERVTRVRKVRKGGEDAEVVGEVSDGAEVVEGVQETEETEETEMEQEVEIGEKEIGEEVEMMIGEGDEWWRPWGQADVINIDS